MLFFRQPVPASMHTSECGRGRSFCPAGKGFRSWVFFPMGWWELPPVSHGSHPYHRPGAAVKWPCPPWSLGGIWEASACHQWPPLAIPTPGPTVWPNPKGTLQPVLQGASSLCQEGLPGTHAFHREHHAVPQHCHSCPQDNVASAAA